MGENHTNGAFLMSRSFFNSDIWWTCPPEDVKIFLYLVGKAAYKERRYKGYTLERGQYFCDNKELLDQLKYSIGFRKKSYNESFMKNLMKRLRKLLMVATTKKPRGMVVTICNYNSYQTLNNYERTTEETTEETTKKPTENQKCPSITKERKERVRKEKNISSHSEPEEPCSKMKPENLSNAHENKEKLFELEGEFEKLWVEYPKRKGRRQNKKHAKTWFIKNVTLEESPDVLVAVQNYSKFCAEKNQYAKDCIVFFHADWREWLEESKDNEKKFSSMFDTKEEYEEWINE